MNLRNFRYILSYETKNGKFLWRSHQSLDYLWCTGQETKFQRKPMPNWQVVVFLQCLEEPLPLPSKAYYLRKAFSLKPTLHTYSASNFSFALTAGTFSVLDSLAMQHLPTQPYQDANDCKKWGCFLVTVVKCTLCIRDVAGGGVVAAAAPPLWKYLLQYILTSKLIKVN
jgi:hypothetical protein